MSKQFKRMYCEDCKKVVKAEDTKRINHPLHILLTLLTSGMWLVVYGCILIGGPKYSCSECGSYRIEKSEY
jgi:hypothetical protein